MIMYVLSISCGFGAIGSIALSLQIVRCSRLMVLAYFTGWDLVSLLTFVALGLGRPIIRLGVFAIA